MMKKFLSGRSMIEMLGVLAVIGILSIGTVNMYRNAMLRYRLGQTQHWIEHVRFLFAEACENGNRNACFTGSSGADYTKRADYVCSMEEKALCPRKNSAGYRKVQTPLKESALLLFIPYTLDSLRFYFRGLDKKTCEAVIDYDWYGLTNITNYDNGKTASVQAGQKYLTQEQKDMLKADCPLSWYLILSFDLKS